MPMTSMLPSVADLRRRSPPLYEVPISEANEEISIRASGHVQSVSSCSEVDLPARPAWVWQAHQSVRRRPRFQPTAKPLL